MHTLYMLTADLPLPELVVRFVQCSACGRNLCGLGINAHACEVLTPFDFETAGKVCHGGVITCTPLDYPDYRL